MTDKPNYRRERIERLLEELKYEVTRGMMEKEIDESLQYIFLVPVSNIYKEGVVHCAFSTRPVHRNEALLQKHPPRLTVVK